MMTEPIRLFVFGLGYSATTLARRMVERGASVAGTVRTTDKAEVLANEGIRALLFDGVARSSDVAAELDRATHVLISIAPGDTDDPVIARYADDLLSAASLRWIGYLSTVGGVRQLWWRLGQRANDAASKIETV